MKCKPDPVFYLRTKCSRHGPQASSWLCNVVVPWTHFTSNTLLENPPHTDASHVKCHGFTVPLTLSVRSKLFCYLLPEGRERSRCRLELRVPTSPGFGWTRAVKPPNPRESMHSVLRCFLPRCCNFRWVTFSHYYKLLENKEFTYLLLWMKHQIWWKVLSE